MIVGTSGRMAFALGKSSRPLIPGMLMSDRSRIMTADAVTDRLWGIGDIVKVLEDWENAQ